MPEYSENDVALAIEAIGRGQSIRQASRHYGVPRTTLQRRIEGVEPRRLAFRHQMKLSVTQEDHLASWIITQSQLANPPTHEAIRLFARRILIANGDDSKIGKRWLRCFLKRYPSITTQRRRRIDSGRINGATDEILKSWFERLLPEAIQSVKPENRWNFDEVGITEGRGDNGLVLGSFESQNIKGSQSGLRVWTSFVECVSATGRFLTPLLIYQGKTLQQQHFPSYLTPYKGWEFTPHEKAGICDETALEWLKKVFLPNTVPEGTPEGDTPKEPRLLICDSRGSHITDEFMWECCKNNVYLLYLPPHTSHVLQPLDVGIFGLLKQAYCKFLGDFGHVAPNTASRKREFIRAYEKARREALNPSNITAGWRSSGLWPVSVRKALANPLVIFKDREIPDRAVSMPPEATGDIGIASQVKWSTPRPASQLKDMLHLFDQLDPDPRTKRLLFRKIKKAFDEKNTELAINDREIQVLRARVDNIRTRKRKRVQMSPDSKFANTRKIQEAQLAAGMDTGDSDILSSDSESIASTISCIEVKI